MRKYVLVLMFYLLSVGIFLEAYENGYTFDIFQTDHWTISMYDADKIDHRIIKVFAAFAVDKQAYFKEDR